MMMGINTEDGEMASLICARCFEKGLIIETSGGNDEVVKVLCPLTIDIAKLDKGLDIIEDAFEAILAGDMPRAAAE